MLRANMKKNKRPIPKRNIRKTEARTSKKQVKKIAVKGHVDSKKFVVTKKTPAEKAIERKALKELVKKKAVHDKEREMVLFAEQERIKAATLLENEAFVEFIAKNVGKKAINIIKLLHLPQTDDKLAADLSVKINEVRRILNVLDSYGVARYDTNKDSKGWLTFKWYLDTGKLAELNQEVMTRKPESAYKLPEDCNDFFFCNSCYEEQKMILPFDAAFEAEFKCSSCGKQLKQLSKQEAMVLFEKEIKTNTV